MNLRINIIIYLNNINQLIFIMKPQSIFFEVGIELYIIWINFRLLKVKYIFCFRDITDESGLVKSYRTD
jgi:hypothetical protein